MKVKAPWTKEFVRKMWERQEDESRHPYTCPGERTECKALGRLLVPTEPFGWLCRCGHYKQDWEEE